MLSDARVISLAETVSTNTEAMDRALNVEPLPFWVTALRQTGGRGRSGRDWVSLPGNLHASLAIGLSCDVARAAQLSLVAGVGVVAALRALAPDRKTAEAIRLKWPNDILIEGAKCGGILVQTAVSRDVAQQLGSSDFSSGGLIAVIGVGVNVVDCPKVELRQTTALRAYGIRETAPEVLHTLRSCIREALDVWRLGLGFAAIRDQWLAAATPVGTDMRIHAGDAVAEGRFAGLDVDGALLMDDTTGRRVRFTFGDVTLI
jgi:BirA family transcriptional regulator, biotin operon repressor / biotin---[acetyl-CoA-carboxylase] ligase